ncbi:MAG: hypothetical protein ACXADL_12090 [Candidatus Thorarchaeota archaeon]
MMQRERGMFRVYRCPCCSNIGYASVETEEDGSKCTLCNAMILHESGTIYAVTVQEAQANVRELAYDTLSRSSIRTSSRGRGLKKRVFYIIEALVDLNRGRPVTVEQILRECSDAGIDLGRAMSFLEALESEGQVVHEGAKIRVSGSGQI